MAPTASIVVLAYGNRPVTERCLGTIAAALGDDLGSAYELVLVDNDSPDDTADLFAGWSDRAVVVTLPENANFAGGCNAGARAASGEVLLFLNNDTEVPPGAIEQLAAEALAPGVGAVGARLVYPDGTLQHAGVVHRETQPGMVLPFHVFHFEPGDLPQACATYDLDAVTGACLATRRALFEELGGFDEAYVNGLEDVDLCLRLRTAGQRVVYRGDVCLVHHERLTRGAGHDESDNLGIFLTRWRDLLDDDSPLIGGLFGVRFDDVRRREHPGDHVAGAPVSVEGRLRSAAPEAFEARALVAALAEAGVEPAARDWGPTWEAPSEPGPAAEAVTRAVARARRPSAVTIQVPAGRLWSLPPGSAAVARLATAPRSGPLAVEAVWAASPGLIDELADGGFPRERAVWLPPLLPDVAVGPGGEGILALLPGHDAARCTALLEALAAFAGLRVRLLPTVASPVLARLAAELAPGAELLPPAPGEDAVAGLAGACDLVCAADGDPFERRALLSAAAGAAVVTPGAGPAAAVLGSAVSAGAGEPAALRAALERALGRSPSREAGAGLVRAACGPGAARERLRELVAELVSRRRPQGLLKRAAPRPITEATRS